MTKEDVDIIMVEFEKHAKTLADMTDEEQEAWSESLRDLADGQK